MNSTDPPRVERTGFTRLPRAVLDDLRLSNHAKIAYLILVDSDVDDDGRSTITHARISERLGISLRHANRAMKELVTLGYVQNVAEKGKHCPVWERQTYDAGGIGKGGAKGAVRDSTSATGGIGRSQTSAKIDANLCQKDSSTSATGGRQPNLSLSKLNSRGPKKENDDPSPEQRKGNVRSLSTLSSSIVAAKRIPEAVA